MNHESKLTTKRLAKKAIVYLRQSSEMQVRHNTESQKLQYALGDRARGLGFHNVEVIDCDLGCSASLGARKRKGFQQVLAAVALGEVGLVLCRELSRLSRTDKDFCHLLELCQIFDTLIGDAESLYDPNTMDDQLVLGIKGTLSVVELKVLRMRLIQGMENKAARGELYRMLPAGYVLDANRRPIKDPNLRIQEAMALVFATFRETGSMRQTFKWFCDHDVALPVNKVRGGHAQIVFQLPSHSFIGDVLTNPFYAGAYTYGRRPNAYVLEEGALRKRQGRVLAPEEARVFIRDHHESYIDWATYEENRRVIGNNNFRSQPDVAAGVVRAGHGLLTGLLRCGRCGRKLHVHYWGKAGTAARYLCKGDFDAGGAYCLSFGGSTVDKRFEQEVLLAISPLGARASLQALEVAGTKAAGQRQLLEREVQQLDYEATRAFEQYNEVDPRNRLVALDLERRWNEKLSVLERARAAHEVTAQEVRALSEPERHTILELGEHFADVWGSARCSMDLKKKITRTVVEEVIVDETSPRILRFIVHWKGGVHTAFEMGKPRSPFGKKTDQEDLDIIRGMAARYGDDDIARVLNKLGRTTGMGKRWSAARVKTARRNHDIAGHTRTPPNAAVLSLQAAARHSDVSDTAIKRLVDARILPMHQVAPWAPWEIQRADLEAEPVRGILARLRKTGRLDFGGDKSAVQSELFQQKQ